ncbi:MAG: rhomboid family intramembrane serine protease [Planctomycetes bacterium]|nr:rhomboid family intramembrane serine protease [Planctomycetota bacterium]
MDSPLEAFRHSPDADPAPEPPAAGDRDPPLEGEADGAAGAKQPGDAREGGWGGSAGATQLGGARGLGGTSPQQRFGAAAGRAPHPVRAVYLLALVYLAVYLLPRLWPGSDGGPPLDLLLFLELAHDRLKVWDGEHWRLITSTFLHEGWFHLACNLAGLVLFGRPLERLLGSGRFLLGYAISLAGGALAFQAFSGTAPGIGASGGICGILAIFITAHSSRVGRINPLARAHFWFWMAAAAGLLIAEAPLVGSAFRMASGRPVDVALSVHLGGFACGAIFGFLSFAPARTPAIQRWAARLLLGGVLVSLGAYGLVYPVFDWAWQLRASREARRLGDRERLRDLLEAARSGGGDEAARWILEDEIEDGRIPEALEYWRKRPLEDPTLHRRAGYVFLYDALAAEDRVEASQRVLDELIELTDQALRKERTVDLLNEAAWYRALRESDLAAAELLAREALERLERESGDAGRRQDEAVETQVINTLGWVLFLRGEHGEGWRLLEDAARRLPIGPHFAYLALAAFQRGERAAAGRYATLALSKGELLRHEKRLMERIQEALVSG